MLDQPTPEYSQSLESLTDDETKVAPVQKNKYFVFFLSLLIFTILAFLLGLFFFTRNRLTPTTSSVPTESVNQYETTSAAEKIEPTESATTITSSNLVFSFEIPANWAAYEYNNNNNISNSQAIALKPLNSVSTDPEYGVITIMYAELGQSITLEQFINSFTCPEGDSCEVSGVDIMVDGVRAKKIKNAGGPLPSDQVFLISNGIGYSLLINYDISETFDPEVPGSDYKTESGKQNEKIFNQVIDSFKFL